MTRHPWQPEPARIARARLAQREQRAALLHKFYEQDAIGFADAFLEFYEDDPAVLETLGRLSVKAYARAAGLLVRH